MRWLRKLRSLFRKDKLDAEMTEEMRHHVELQAELNVKAGMNPDKARHTALRQFGNVASIQEQAREGRGWVWLEQAVKDVGVAVRRLKRSPSFFLAVVAILGVCLGGNLTIFAWVDAILLRPLPFPEAERLVLVFNSYPQAGVMRDGSSFTNYYERRGQLPAFSGVALYRPRAAIVGDPTSTQRENIIFVSPDFFDVLGRGPMLGRAFTEAETTLGTSNVVIISDAYWRKHFDADPQVIGRPLTVNGRPNTIVGVLPPDFRFLSFTAQLYFPTSSRPEDRGPARRHSGGNVTQMIARLSPGSDLQSAQTQIDAHNTAMEKDGSEADRLRAAGFRSVVVSLHGDHVAGIRPTLWLMQAGGLLLLLIGAANLVNLLLLRATERRKDLAVRQALGASRQNVVTEVMVEIMLLTLAGGALGLAAGAAGIELSGKLGADRLPLGAAVVMDTRLALLSAGGVSALGILVGLMVATLVLRIDPRAALHSSSLGTTASRAMRRLRRAFLVVQLALAFVLLAAAGQLVVSFRKSLAVSPGFQADDVLTEKMWISPTAAGSSLAGYVTVTERLFTEIARQPGVTAVGLATNLPFGGLDGKGAVTAKGWVPPVGESPRGHILYNVTGDYFAAMNVELRAGRFLTMDDSRRPERVCVVDEDFARYHWPDRTALGQIVFEGPKAGNDTEGYAVVGVVGRVKHTSLTDNETPGAVYFPLGHRPDRDVYIVVRTSQERGIAGDAVQRIVKAINPTISLSEGGTMRSRVDDSLISRRSPAMLGGFFAGVALLLAAVGTYGLLSYAVTQQYREIAIRVALGARPGQISRQFLSLGVLLLAGGTILGSVGIWATGRAMQTVLFEVPAFPIGIWSGTVVVMAGVTLLACLWPARRAAKVDPVSALRAE